MEIGRRGAATLLMVSMVLITEGGGAKERKVKMTKQRVQIMKAA